MNTPAKNALEWTVFALSLALVLGVVGYLLYGSATEEDTPPTFSVEVGTGAWHGDRYHLPLTLHNRGGTTASSVVLAVTAGRERAELTFAFAPRYSTREGAALLSHAPHPDSVEAHVVGYELP